MSSVEYNKLLKARSPILNPPIAPLNPSTQPPPSSISHEGVLYPNDRNLAVDAMMRRQGPQQQPFDPNYHANFSGNSSILASVDDPKHPQQLAAKPLYNNPPTVNARPTAAEAMRTTRGGSKKRKYKRARKVRKSRTRSRSRSRGRMSRRYK